MFFPDACYQRARALPVGQEPAAGQFTLEPNTKSQNHGTHPGYHKAALPSLHVQLSVTHPGLIVPARNGAIAKTLPVLSVHEPSMRSTCRLRLFFFLHGTCGANMSEVSICST